MVDYSKWDSIVDSDSDGDGGPSPAPSQMPSRRGPDSAPSLGGGGGLEGMLGGLGGMFGGPGGAAPGSSGGAASDAATFDWPCELGPGASTHDLSPTVFRDPRTFVPVPTWAGNLVLKWGLVEKEGLGGIMDMIRAMSQNNSFGSDDHIDSPELQWCKRRGEAVADRIARARANAGPPVDLVLRVEMGWLESDAEEPDALCRLEPPVVRRLKVSSTTVLNTFHDKILGPAMGWVRNYHGYFFTDVSDGTIFAPYEKSNAVDMMHFPMHCTHCLDPWEFTLGDLLTEVGDRLLYVAPPPTTTPAPLLLLLMVLLL